MSCEDFPCCGHELGCCPDFVNGRQINMVCVCGARLPINNPTSICNACLRDDDDDYGHERYEDEDDVDDMDESMDGDFDSGMTSAGFGTDEDYGFYGGDDSF